MNQLEIAITDSLRAQAQGAAMATDTPHEQEILESRLDVIDHQTHTRRIIWGTVAAVAAAVLIVVGARTFLGSTTSQQDTVGPPAPKHLYTSEGFAVPFTVDSLPSWLTTHTLNLDGQHTDALYWNRCPQNSNECIGLAFTRMASVKASESAPQVKVDYKGYVAYLDRLGRSGKVSITGRRSTTVDGRPAIVYSITSPTDQPTGLGCHVDDTLGCEEFFPGVPGKYAVVDTGSLDPSGAVLVIYTRAGGVGPAEEGWLEQFDQMLTTLKFTGKASATK
jgi:hypothetical protein